MVKAPRPEKRLDYAAEWDRAIPRTVTDRLEMLRNERIGTYFHETFEITKKSSRTKKFELPKVQRFSEISGNPGIFVQQIQDFPSKTVPDQRKPQKVGKVFLKVVLL